MFEDYKQFGEVTKAKLTTNRIWAEANPDAYIEDVDVFKEEYSGWEITSRVYKNVITTVATKA